MKIKSEKADVAVRDFLKCGLTGWCIEILFTSANALRNHDFTLRGQTSLWMFPIYGCAFLIAPLSKVLGKYSVLLRGTIYMTMIFSMEYLTGILLSAFHLCPWDYSGCRWNVSQVIRLDYAPYWFGTGLLFEKLLQKKE